jgi:hypothetical protein
VFFWDEVDRLLEENKEARLIPELILKWLVSSRLRLLDDIKEGKPVNHFSAHLPVMATWQDRSPFPVNMTVKGIGLIPKKKFLERFSGFFEEVFTQAQDKPWEQSLPQRIDTLLTLYRDIDHFDPVLLGGLEIFEGNAFSNLKKNPHASFLYSGTTDTTERFQYISFQIDGAVELLSKNDSYYRFLLASRKLFEFEHFHLPQNDYPWGYLIRVLEVRDKSPWIVKR